MSGAQNSFPTSPVAGGGGPLTGTVVTATTRMVTPTIGTSAGTQHPIPTGTEPILTAGSTIDASLTLITDIPASSLDAGLAPRVPPSPVSLATGVPVSNGTTYDLAAKWGGTVTLAQMPKGGAGTWYPTEFIGLSAMVLGSSGTATDQTPWVAPVAGTLRNLRVQGNGNTAASTVVTVVSSSGGDSLLYTTSTLTCTIGSGHKSGSDTTHSLSLAAGACVLVTATMSSNWTTDGLTVTAEFVPN